MLLFGLLIFAKPSFAEYGTITFSNPSPYNQTLPTNDPVRFSITLTDDVPISGIRYVSLFIDGSLKEAQTYYRNATDPALTFSGNSLNTYYFPAFGSHTWYVRVSDVINTKSINSDTFSFNFAPPLVKTPGNLSFDCSFSANGQLNYPQPGWCNAYSPKYYTADVYTDGRSGTAYFKVPSVGSYTQELTQPLYGSGDANYAIPSSVYAPLSILAQRTYTYEVWTKGLGWESKHAFGNFRVDSTPPNPGPGKPALNPTAGGLWYVEWLTPGYDQISGIYSITLKIFDGNILCSKQTSTFSTYKMPFSCYDPATRGGTSKPLSGHTYKFEVISCDRAANCATSVGYHTGGTPVSTISPPTPTPAPKVLF